MLGFGDSEPRVPDHSFAAQAAALTELLDHLGVERAHWVGFSWGGGVAIELAARIPERTASLILVSALGVQELELLGDFTLNRLVHRLQHALVVGLQWFVPHFGTFENSPLSTGFSRSFLDSDQRPLRPALEAYAGPMLIVHGQDDFLVPPAAAKEHARLVPPKPDSSGSPVATSFYGATPRTSRTHFGIGSRRSAPISAATSPAARLSRRGSQPRAVPFERSLAGPQSASVGWCSRC